MICKNMTNVKPIKSLDVGSESAVAQSVKAVDLYRQRYRELLQRFASFKEMVIEIGKLDPDLAGYDGIILLIGVNNNRRGENATKRIVRLMEQLRPDSAEPTPSRIGRQKLSKSSILSHTNQ
jgi:hypothetical protein